MNNPKLDDETSCAEDEQEVPAAPASPKEKFYPDGGWGWVVALGSALSHFLVVGLGRSFGLFYLTLLDMFQDSAAATSLVVAIYNTTRQMLGPIAGILVDRFTVQKVVFVGGIVMLVGCIISAFALNILYLYITFGLLTGVGGALIFAPSYIIVGQYFDKKKGTAMGLATIGSGLGTVALAPIITALLKNYSFFGAMLIMGAIQLNNCVSACLFRPLPQWRYKPKVKPENELQELGNGEADDEPKKSKCKVPKSFQILKNITFLIYGLQIMAMSVCIQTFLTFLPGIAQERGVNDDKASLLLSIVGFSDMISRFCWGFFFDIKTVRHRRRLFHALLGLPLGGFCVMTGLMPNYVSLVVLTVLFGLVEGGFHAQRATIVSEFVDKEQMSSTVGFVICFQGVGNLLGPPIGGALRDASGSYSPAYYFSGCAIVFTSSLFLLDYFCHWLRNKGKSKNLQSDMSSS